MNKKVVFLALFLLLAFVAFYFYHRTTTAPALRLQELQAKNLDETPFDWQALKGKKTLLCFGASWCVDCRRELKNLLPLSSKELSEVQIVVISDEPVDKIKAYREKTAYPYLFLKLSHSFSEHGIYSVPTNYLLNSNLEVVKEKTGEFNWNDPSTRQHLLQSMDN